MGTVTPIRNDVLPAPFSVYQRKGFVDCEPREADGFIWHTREGEKRHYLREPIGWYEVEAWEYLQAMAGDR